MKNYIILLVLAFGFQYTNAQEFQETKKYTSTNEIVEKQQESDGSLITIVVADDKIKRVATIELTEPELFESTEISVLENPDLENINEIIKVELVYVACCASSESYYFLATDTGDFISLPSLENVYCDGPEPEVTYIFPTQEYGKEGTIIRTEVHYTENYTIKDIEILQSYALNDDDFDYEEAVTVVQ